MKEFNDYKEMQKYYKSKANEQTTLWVSAMPNNTKENAHKVKKDLLIKGRTYTKQKESE